MNNTEYTVNTHLSEAIEIVGDKEKYDECVKELLADKQVLAMILKYSLKEFKNDSIEEIIRNMGNSMVSSVYVDSGMTNYRKVSKDSEEDNVPGEGKIVYDIRFSIYHMNELIKVLMNVEAQKSTKVINLGYHLDNRVIYYLSRMTSSQKQVEFTNSNYDDIKAVRSIWICMDGDVDEDSISRIYLKQEDVYGKGIELTNLDKMVGVIIRIRKKRNANESRNKLIAMLEELLNQKDVSVKKKNLMEKYDLIMNQKLERGLQEMCNLSDVLVEQGIEQGIERGKEQGKEQGRKMEIFESVQAHDYSLQRGAEKLGITIEELKKEMQELKCTL